MHSEAYQALSGFCPVFKTLENEVPDFQEEHVRQYILEELDYSLVLDYFAEKILELRRNADDSEKDQWPLTSYRLLRPRMTNLLGLIGTPSKYATNGIYHILPVKNRKAFERDFPKFWDQLIQKLKFYWLIEDEPDWEITPHQLPEKLLLVLGIDRVSKGLIEDTNVVVTEIELRKTLSAVLTKTKLSLWESRYSKGQYSVNEFKDKLNKLAAIRKNYEAGLAKGLDDHAKARLFDADLNRKECMPLTRVRFFQVILEGKARKLVLALRSARLARKFMD